MTERKNYSMMVTRQEWAEMRPELLKIRKAGALIEPCGCGADYIYLAMMLTAEEAEKVNRIMDTL